MPDQRAIRLFAVVCAVCVGGIILTANWSRIAGLIETSGDRASATSAAEAGLGSSRLYFRYTGMDENYGRVAFLEGADSNPVFRPGLSCQAVHASADKGICLSADRGVITAFQAHVFDTESHEVIGQFSLSGTPSRTRVSPDGRYAASTVFVKGHAYSTIGFSTQTMLYDVDAMSVIADLETFKVTRRGAEFSNTDFNFWGVTFTPDSRQFYATLSTGDEHLLVQGDIAARTMAVIHEGVECPSLSPDGTRVAYKRRSTAPGGVRWSLHVLRLDDKTDIALADDRSIDDQLEWLNDEQVLYSVPDESSPAVTNVWTARADGSGDSTLFLASAYSPAIAR